MRKGFTLVELLIVLAVIAALMAVATPLALNAVRRAKASQVAQNMRAILQAAVTHLNSEKEVPTLDQIKSAVTGLSDWTNYSVTITGPTQGKYTITVEYTGTDVTAEDLNKAWDRISNKKVTEEVQKWW